MTRILSALMFPVTLVVAHALAPNAAAQGTPRRYTLRLQTQGWFGLALDCKRCDREPQPGEPRELPVIARVLPDSPADRASLQPGDTILALDGKELSARELRAKLSTTPPSQPVELLMGTSRGRFTYKIRPLQARIRVVAGDSLPVRYHGEFAEVTIDVLSTSVSPVVTRDSTGAMLIRLGEHVLRLQRGKRE